MSSVFSEDVDSLLTLAKRIAREASHEYLGTEHIFAAMCESEVRELEEFLKRRGIGSTSVAEIIRAEGRGRTFRDADLPFTPNAKEVLCRAIRLTCTPPVSIERLLYALVEAVCCSNGTDGAACLLARLEIPFTEMLSVLPRIEPPECWPPDSPPLVEGRTRRST